MWGKYISSSFTSSKAKTMCCKNEKTSWAHKQRDGGNDHQSSGRCSLHHLHAKHAGRGGKHRSSANSLCSRRHFPWHRLSNGFFRLCVRTPMMCFHRCHTGLMGRPLLCKHHVISCRQQSHCRALSLSLLPLPAGGTLLVRGLNIRSRLFFFLQKCERMCINSWLMPKVKKKKVEKTWFY